ncbi:MAG: hypothetical protein IKZ37_03600, partial [Bacteroidaceae bacterium]|nr:hypothetical protein [Bacteroidaceae bacterium]
KFLKKVIIILEAVISLFFMFKTARFLLSLGYVARYAPSKNNKTFHFALRQNRLHSPKNQQVNLRFAR